MSGRVLCQLNCIPLLRGDHTPLPTAHVLSTVLPLSVCHFLGLTRSLAQLPDTLTASIHVSGRLLEVSPESLQSQA